MRRTPPNSLRAAAAIVAALALVAVMVGGPATRRRPAPTVTALAVAGPPSIPTTTSSSTASTSTTSTTLPTTTSTTELPPRATPVEASRSDPAPAPAPEPAAPSDDGSEVGGASWYAYIAGTCAHKTLPKGTIVTVVVTSGPYAGRSTTCRVADRGPYIAGRVIDLDEGVFAQLAPTSAGVLPVRISW